LTGWPLLLRIPALWNVALGVPEDCVLYTPLKDFAGFLEFGQRYLYHRVLIQTFISFHSGIMDAWRSWDS
jgi:hypothetical protein